MDAQIIGGTPSLHCLTALVPSYMPARQRVHTHVLREFPPCTTLDRLFHSTDYLLGLAWVLVVDMSF